MTNIYLIFLALVLAAEFQGNLCSTGAISRSPTGSSSTQGSVKLNPPDLILNPHHIITNQPTVRNYTFVITNQTGAPDGFVRSMLVINNQFPGPMIEANEGDTINVLVQNQQDRPTSIHWHGIHQNGSPWMDGISGVTQCPIPGRSSFLYSFQVNQQFGTFWYHAHTNNLKADGIVGPLIIHSTRDPLVRGKDFDSEKVVVLSDWYHDTSTLIMNQMLSLQGYNGSFAAPSPNSGLLNGIGFFDCEKFAGGRPCRTNRNPLDIQVAPNSRTRLRLIQAGARALFRVSVDGHPLKVIEADATPVQSKGTYERLQIHSGQRYSVIIDTSKDKEGDSFFFRAAIDVDCLSWVAPGMDTDEGSIAKAIIRVTTPKSHNDPNHNTLPESRDWNVTTQGPCYEWDNQLMTPIIQSTNLDNVQGRVFFNSSFGVVFQLRSTNSSQQVQGRFSVNNVTYLSRNQSPLLHHMLQGGSKTLNTSEVSVLTMDRPGIWDIVVNNLDQGLEHPYHLHGVDSCVVAVGNGTLNDASAATIQYNTQNPVCRDVQVIPGGSYAVFRVNATNPGVWFFHCHMGWHLAAGFAGVVLMEPDKLSQMQLPRNNEALCQARSQDTLTLSQSS